jgi:hypothetical protein
MVENEILTSTLGSAGRLGTIFRIELKIFVTPIFLGTGLEDFHKRASLVPNLRSHQTPEREHGS